MVYAYTCFRECYFLDRFFEVGDEIILDEKVGDSCCHLQRSNKDFSALQKPKQVSAKPVSKPVATTATVTKKVEVAPIVGAAATPVTGVTKNEQA